MPSASVSVMSEPPACAAADVGPAIRRLMTNVKSRLRATRARRIGAPLDWCRGAHESAPPALDQSGTTRSTPLVPGPTRVRGYGSGVATAFDPAVQNALW